MTKKQIIIGAVIVIALAVITGAFLYMQPTEPGEIKIGAIAPLSGPAALYGEGMKRGIDLAVEELNANGGINGNKIQIVYEDSQIDPKLAVSAIQKLISVDKVPVVIGPMGSSEVLSVAPIAERKHVVVLSPTASTPEITNAGDYIFRNIPSDVYEGSETAKFAYQQLGFRKIAILYINNDYGVGLRDVFKRTFESLGGTITVAEAYEPGANDFRTQLTRIKDSEPEAIYSIAYKENIQILKQIKELGIDAQILGTTPFEDPEILEKAGETAEGVIYAFVGYDPTSESEEVQQFLHNFSDKYGIQPDPSAAMSYDAMKIVALAIEKGGYTADGIKEALYGIKNFPGVAGLTSFDENGDAMKPIQFRIVKNGKFVKYD
jgi:branched-chain amino acid transport system substrate-binding protein